MMNSALSGNKRSATDDELIGSIVKAVKRGADDDKELVEEEMADDENTAPKGKPKSVASSSADDPGKSTGTEVVGTEVDLVILQVTVGWKPKSVSSKSKTSAVPLVSGQNVQLAKSLEEGCCDLICGLKWEVGADSPDVDISASSVGDSVRLAHLAHVLTLTSHTHTHTHIVT